MLETQLQDTMNTSSVLQIFRYPLTSSESTQLPQKKTCKFLNPQAFHLSGGGKNSNQLLNDLKLLARLSFFSKPKEGALLRQPLVCEKPLHNFL